MRTETRPTQFAKYDQNAGKVLTVIIDVDQSSNVNRNHDFEIPVNSKLREIESRIKDESELEQYRRCVDLALGFIKSYRPSSKSVAVFAQANGNVSTRELNVALKTETRWQALPHIQPLMEAGDEFEQLLIVLLDGRHCRFLTSILGNITEHPDILNPYPTGHTQAPGNDQTKSQPTFHRRSDEREQHYLKSVSEMAESMAATKAIDRIVLAGNNGACKDLYSVLPKTLQRHVISFIILPVQATLEQITDAVKQPRYQAERKNESAKVAALLDRSGTGAKAVTGVDDTTAALADGRVHELVYAHGIALSGARCIACDSIVVGYLACPKCHKVLGPVGDAMDMIIVAALDTGATIEQVRGEASETLMSAGGIGAFLRY